MHYKCDRENDAWTETSGVTDLEKEKEQMIRSEKRSLLHVCGALSPKKVMPIGRFRGSSSLKSLLLKPDDELI